MKVESILKTKGRRVHTTLPITTVAQAIDEFSAANIGALVVSSDGEKVEGVISEREIVRGLARHGAKLLGMPVKDLMSRPRVCTPHETVEQVMKTMTISRTRHLPVVEDGKLCGIVSIGDVVKSRLQELELEVGVLRDAYIARR